MLSCFVEINSYLIWRRKDISMLRNVNSRYGMNGYFSIMIGKVCVMSGKIEV
jgi:hypothetical protein